VQFLALALVVRAGHGDRAVLVPVDRDGLSDDVRQLTLRTLDGDRLAVDRDVDAGRDRDRELADARHSVVLLPVLRHQT
jgi:hypothetical protein